MVRPQRGGKVVRRKRNRFIEQGLKTPGIFDFGIRNQLRDIVVFLVPTEESSKDIHRRTSRRSYLSKSFGMLIIAEFPCSEASILRRLKRDRGNRTVRFEILAERKLRFCGDAVEL